MIKLPRTGMVKNRQKKRNLVGSLLAIEDIFSIHAPIRGCGRAYTQLVAVLVLTLFLTLFQCSTALSTIDNRTFILDVKGPG